MCLLNLLKHGERVSSELSDNSFENAKADKLIKCDQIIYPYTLWMLSIQCIMCLQSYLS